MKQLLWLRVVLCVLLVPQLAPGAHLPLVVPWMAAPLQLTWTQSTTSEAHLGPLPTFPHAPAVRSTRTRQGSLPLRLTYGEPVQPAQAELDEDELLLVDTQDAAGNQEVVFDADTLRGPGEDVIRYNNRAHAAEKQQEIGSTGFRKDFFNTKITDTSDTYCKAIEAVHTVAPQGGVFGALGKMFSWAKRGAKVAKLLPAVRQIQTAWSVSTYKHGGLMTGMEHIIYRHSANSGFANVSRYAPGTTAKNIVGYVDDALRYGTVTPNGTGAYIVEHNLGRVISANVAGESATSIRVFVRDGVIQTAFPF